MIPEIGHFTLILSCCLAVVQGVLPLLGAALGRASWMGVARPAAAGQFVFVTLALGCLTYSFFSNDFSVYYVAQNSNSQLPWIYRVTAVWGGHEGSMLLWIWILALWTLAVAIASRSLPTVFAARVLGVMGLVSVGFLLFTLFTSNPFHRLFPVPADGRDLNPLLQDPGMVIHPPMLYMGYVGFSVAFSLAVAAMLGGRLDATWARWSRPWTTIAWMFLTVGIALGSRWAYYELGWGGWWFWDPVENASFMPWLVGTALIHSLAATEKRGTFKAWTVLLAIAAFSLSLLGTFLVRSGVLTSVHAFATDPTRGVFILIFLVIVIGGSLLLYAWRAPTLQSFGRFSLLSRESLLLANNVLLVVACGSVLLGTLYPLAVDAMGLGNISVGPPYFNTVFVPIMLPLVFLIGVGPLVAWRRAEPKQLMSRLQGVFLVSVALAAIIVVFWVGIEHYVLGLTVFLALWVVGSALQGIYDRIRRRGGGLAAFGALPRSYYGMQLAHIGIAVFMIGAGVVSTFDIERNLRMEPGDEVEVAGYHYRFEGVRAVSGPNYEAAEGLFVVSRGGDFVAELRPQKRVYTVRQQTMTQVAFDPGFLRDVFAALGEPLGGGAWSVRIHHKPMVRWIWFGAWLMALGGILAATDRRYRRVSGRQSALKKKTPESGAAA